jgi:hypothetical protein
VSPVPHAAALNRCRQYEPEYKLLEHPHLQRVVLVGDDRTPTRPQAAVLARFPGRDWMPARCLRDVRLDVMRRIQRYRWADCHPPHAQGSSAYWSLTSDGERALQRWRAREAQRPIYRCAECGHGRHLTAWANVCAHGPLGPDGHLTRYDWDEEDEIHEDSIQCTIHPDGAIEHRVGERWHRWWACPKCSGTGKASSGYPCHAAGLQDDGSLRDDECGAHHGWRPNRATAAP